ncbi:MAG TPA: TVP38/TMEM64 family protein [Syntrophales bacterium]|nr:TVP38/TMEM64 family protein [Syntrophales bacterium]
MNGRLAFRILILLLLIILSTYFFIHFDLYVLFSSRRRVIEFVNSFHPYDQLVFISLQILQVVAAPIPGEVTGLIGGYLYGPVLGTIYSTIGLTISSWIAFVLARFFGLPLVEKVVSTAVIEKYDYFLEHRGLFVSFLLFLIPGFPKDYLCYIMGASHMTTWHFLGISTTGRLLGTVLLSVSGSYARNDQYMELLFIAGVSCLLIAIAYFYRDKWLEELKRRHIIPEHHGQSNPDQNQQENRIKPQN